MADSGAAAAAGSDSNSFFITCGCSNCGDRMRLTNYEPGPENAKGYESGWQCDKCDFDSCNGPGSPMAVTRFYCGSGGCNTDLCILCGRRKLPVFELHVGMGERTYPVEFQTPLLSVAIESFDETMTGSGTHYIMEIADQTGAQWRLPVRYSQFEKLHNSLEEGTWSAEQPADPPFPPKEMFPNVQRRCEKLDLYTKALIEQMAKIPEQHVAKLVEFFRATYRPLQPNPKLPVQSFQIAPAFGASYDSAPVTKADPATAREMPKKPRILFCPMQDCSSTMAHTEYTPGQHNVSGYRSGWECDACQFISVNEPNSQKARFRYHCSKCLLDYCIPCGDKLIQTNTSVTPIPGHNANGRAANHTQGSVTPIDFGCQGTDHDYNTGPNSSFFTPRTPNRDHAGRPRVSSPPRLTSLRDVPAQLQPSSRVDAARGSPRQSELSSLGVAGGVASPSVSKLREAKMLLEEGLIHQQDYDDLKTRILAELMPARR